MRKCLRDIDADVYHQVARAGAVALHCGQTLAAKAQSLAGLRSRFYLYLYLAAVIVGISTEPPRTAVGMSRSRL